MLKQLLKNLKSRVIHCGKTPKSNVGFLKNVFGDEHSKTALLSYLTHPFQNTATNLTHSNWQEVLTIAAILREFGFNVDVVDFLYSADGSIQYQKYGLIFGFGHPFENSFHLPFSGKRVFYATGAHSWQRNNVEMLRLRQLRDRTGVMLKPKRIKPYSDLYSASCCDHLICLGSEWTRSTYQRFYAGEIKSLHVSSHHFHPQESFQRNEQNGVTKNFLWMGSSGLVLKGLDVLLEAFRELPDCTVHICAPDKEKELLDLYRDPLESASNVVFHGFVDVSSETFRSICETCGYVLSTSNSEGQSVSCITGMFCGLVPVVTLETGIAVSGFGFEIEDHEVSTLIEVIEQVSEIGYDEWRMKSEATYAYCCENHTIESYRNSLKHLMGEILEPENQFSDR